MLINNNNHNKPAPCYNTHQYNANSGITRLWPWIANLPLQMCDRWKKDSYTFKSVRPIVMEALISFLVGCLANSWSKVNVMYQVISYKASIP